MRRKVVAAGAPARARPNSALLSGRRMLISQRLLPARACLYPQLNFSPQRNSIPLRAGINTWSYAGWSGDAMQRRTTTHSSHSPKKEKGEEDGDFLLLHGVGFAALECGRRYNGMVLYRR